MATPDFTFKKFHVNQDQCAHKVGTDSVLLAAWADVSKENTALDIGTGTGILALMLAQKGIQNVLAIEIDPLAFNQAVSNFSASDFKNSIKALNVSFQDFLQSNRQYFEVIICNPPYFHSSLVGKKHVKNIARHQLSLSYSELIVGVKKLLSDSGSYYCVIPFSQYREVLLHAATHKLYPKKILHVYANKRKQTPIRTLICFSNWQGLCKVDDIFIENYNRHDYTDEYKTLTRDFYLKF